jgi:Thiol:disulfide interchange protein DsbD, N-terminal
VNIRAATPVETDGKMLRVPWLLPAILASFLLPRALTAVEKPDVRAKLIVPPSVGAGSKVTLTVEMKIGEHWHVNSHAPSEPYLIPTVLALTTSRGTLSPIRYPKDVERRFEFADKPLRVYERTVRFEADLEIPAGAPGEVRVTGDLSYQACNERQCFAPAKIPLEATIAGAGEARSSSSDRTFMEDGDP